MTFKSEQIWWENSISHFIFNISFADINSAFNFSISFADTNMYAFGYTKKLFLISEHSSASFAPLQIHVE